VTASSILLVRHAAPEPARPRDTPETDNERPLSSQGRIEAQRLAQSLRGELISAVFASPYRRAVETVEPIAKDHGLAVLLVDDLRERRLASHHPLPEAAFLSALGRARDDPTYALPGGETSSEVLDRTVRALTRVQEATSFGIAVVGTHGGVISILRWHIGETFTIEEALAEPMPAMYLLLGVHPTWRIRPL
jgi:2,3-bisphosphoglycerate-dependent phosphoglycerate mutase